MNKKSRANFLYRIGEVNTIPILLIWDKDLGGVTVTNDIENVVADIALHENIDPLQHMIIYRDSDGRWDGWNPFNKEFYPFVKTVQNIIEQRLNFDFETPQIVKLMNPASNLSIATPQDTEILLFLRWLDINYAKFGPDQYVHPDLLESSPQEAIIYSAAECLAQYRSEQIPQLPKLPNETATSYVNIINEAMRRSTALFNGLARIQALLDPANTLTKEQLSAIVLDTLNQIS